MNNKEYLKWRRHRKHMKVWTSLLCGVVLTGVGVGVGYAIWHNQHNQRKVDDFQIVHLKNTDSGILKNKGDEMWLFADNGYGHVEWSGLDDIDGIVYDTKVPSLLKIEVTKLLTHQGDLNITARDENNDIAKIRISIVGIVFKKIPLTDKYFDLDRTVVEDDTITGFSRYSIEHPDELNEFNAFDFSGQKDTHIKYISGDCQFSGDALNQWKVQKIDFDGLTFLTESENRTGYETFANAQLPSLIILDFGRSIWWDNSIESVKPTSLPQQASTATGTFVRANLSGVIDLNLSGAVFAGAEMVTDLGASARGIVTIAEGTFYEADLQCLSRLDMSGTVFAETNMIKLSGGESYIATALDTFAQANLSNLSDLDLLGTVFAAPNMATVSGALYIAYQTFMEADLSNVNNLDLSSTVFTSSTAPIGTNICPANYTFYNVTFSNLQYLHLTKPYDSTEIWEGTFSENSNQVTIYGYPGGCPQWFNPDPDEASKSLWFPKATWDGNE